MSTIKRRQFLKILATALAAGSLPGFYAARSKANSKIPPEFYDCPMQGDARILHLTDVHGQEALPNFAI